MYGPLLFSLVEEPVFKAEWTSMGDLIIFLLLIEIFPSPVLFHVKILLLLGKILFLLLA